MSRGPSRSGAGGENRLSQQRPAHTLRAGGVAGSHCPPVRALSSTHTHTLSLTHTQSLTDTHTLRLLGSLRRSQFPWKNRYLGRGLNSKSLMSFCLSLSTSLLLLFQPLLSSVISLIHPPLSLYHPLSLSTTLSHSLPPSLSLYRPLSPRSVSLRGDGLTGHQMVV